MKSQIEKNNSPETLMGVTELQSENLFFALCNGYDPRTLLITESIHSTRKLSDDIGNSNESCTISESIFSF